MQFLNYFLEYNRYLNILGIAVILAIAVLFSKKRSHISGLLIFHALLVQLVIAFLVLKTWVGQEVVATCAAGIGRLYKFADDGIRFVFGSLADPSGPWGFIFAIKVLPIIIFFGALTALLFHWKIIQYVVAGMNIVLRPLLRTSGPETLCAAANSFLGQTEAPLLIRNYLKHMTKSEMLVVMVSGMATISGAIMAVFAAMGVPVQHMLASSVMSIPGSIMIAKILYPAPSSSTEDGLPSGYKKDEPSPILEPTTTNAFDAVATGTCDGLNLAINVGAMLIAFLAFLGLVNFFLGTASDCINAVLTGVGSGLQLPSLSIDLIFAYLFAPFGYLLGFTGREALLAGQLLGTKVAVNELIAYGDLVNLHVSDRMLTIMTYALCGFSNFSCIGIQIGGIGALVPERRGWLTELGLYAVLGGALSNLLSAMIAGLLL